MIPQVNFISLVVNLIIREYFANDFCILQISNQDYFESNLTVPSYLFNNVNDGKHIKPAQRCLTFIINHSEMWKTFTALEVLILQINDTRFNQRKYLMLTNNEQSIKKQFSIEYLKYVPDLVIAIAHENNTSKFVDLYSADYFGSDLVKQDRWTYVNNSIIRSAINLYPDKITNPEATGPKKELRAASGYLIPYCNPYAWTGMYIGLLDLYATKYKFVLRANRSRTTVSEIWKKLQTREIDLGFASLFLNLWRYQLADFTGIYYGKFGILVPKPKMLNTWSNYFSLLPREIWFLIFISLLSMICIYNWSGNMFSYYHPNWMYIIGVLCNQSFPTIKPFGNTCSRFRFIVLILSEFFITVIYLTSLSSLITIPRYEKKIDTIEEFARSYIHIVNDDEIMRTPLQFSDNEFLNIIYNRFTFTSRENIQDLIWNRSNALIVTKFNHVYSLESYHNISIITTHRLMKEALYVQQITSYLIKNSPLSKSMSHLTLKCAENGLIRYWIDMALLSDKLTFKTFDAKNQPTIENGLNLDQVVGSFLIYIIGNLVALFTLIIEIVGVRG